MEFNRILKLCATLLQLKDLEKIIVNSEYLSECDNDDLILLKDCVNLVCNNVATDYIKLSKTIRVNNILGVVPYETFAQDKIYKVVKVKNAFGDNIKFKYTDVGIECDMGEIYITYLYFPKDYSFGETIDVFKAELTERIFAFGVCSEYLYIRGNGDDASIWEDRFKNSMRTVVRPRHEITMPKRRWW